MDKISQYIEKFNKENDDFQLHLAPRGKYIDLYLFNSLNKMSFGKSEYIFTNQDKNSSLFITIDIENIDKFSEILNDKLNRIISENKTRIIIMFDKYADQPIVFDASTNKKYVDAIYAIVEHYVLDNDKFVKNEINPFKYEDMNPEILSGEFKEMYDRELKYYNQNLEYIKEYHYYCDLYNEKTPGNYDKLVFDFIALNGYRVYLDNLK